MNAQRVFHFRIAYALLDILLIGGLFHVMTSERAAALAVPESRTVTVDDVITMTRIGDSDYTGGLDSSIAHWSPDRRRFIVLAKKGNLLSNTNDYSLLLWQASAALRHGSPERILTLSSSSNREGIMMVQWLDNERIAFLGENPGHVRQLYTFSLATRTLHKVTNHPTSLLSYAIATAGDRVVFAAEARRAAFRTGEVDKNGIHVSNQFLSDLVLGASDSYLAPAELFVEERGLRSARRLTITDKLPSTGNPIFLSPNGQFAVVLAMVTDMPESWKGYSSPSIQRLVRQDLPKGSVRFLYRYILIDTSNGRSQPLLNAPIGALGSECEWSSDGRSVVVSGVYLPLEVADASEATVRQSSTFVAEIRIPSLDIIKITPGDLQLVRWNRKANELILRDRGLHGAGILEVTFEKANEMWDEIESKGSDESGDGLEVGLDEGLNSPPKIILTNTKTRVTSILADLNPQFRRLQFGRVEPLVWKGGDGQPAKGLIYYPPDYIAGKRYPLVIQTEGIEQKRWWVDGPFSTAFAAQPLASRGIVVLQVIEKMNVVVTPTEAPIQAAVYDGAIDYLDGKGLIDRSKVGIIGFSRTCFYVKYALTHSKYQFAVAVVADGFDAGYFQYIVFANAFPAFTSEVDAINGGPPFGQSLFSWLERAPSFLLDRVHTPIMIQALRPASLLSEWEWFSGLSRLGKPVDMIYMPDAVHLLIKPWERKTSLQGAVDWSCFWLKAEEDPDPTKAEQYKRWRELRRRQAGDAGPTTPADN